MATPEGIENKFSEHMALIEKLMNTYKQGGLMHRSIKSIGGDPAGLHGVRQALNQLFSALEDADYFARSHLTAESQEVEEPTITTERIRKLAGL